MRKLLTLVFVGLVVACGDALSPQLEPAPAAPSILDAANGPEGNPGFWWLPPMVRNPGPTGAFQGLFRPSVVIVCLSSPSGSSECDGELTDSRVATFGIGSGLTVEEDHYHVDLRTRDLDLAVSGPGEATTYRIVVLTDPLPALGGPFVLGHADFQVGRNGRAAKGVASPGEMIGVTAGQTLPIRFFINEDAYPHAIGVFAESGDVPAGQETFCEINCTVTVVSETEPTEATLERNDGSGGEVVALLFEPGDVPSTSVLVLDERVEEGEAADCAPGVNLRKLNCVRGIIRSLEGGTDPVTFNNPVRVGLSVCDVPMGPGTHYVIKKWSRVDGEPVLEEPAQDVDVSDFFDDHCDPPAVGFLGGVTRLARAVADFIVTPAFAGDSLRAGATIRSLSDLFWALDAEASTTATGGTHFTRDVVPVSVKVMGLHPDPDVPLAGQVVHFAVTEGGATLAPAPGFTPLSSEESEGGTIALALETGADGTAVVHLTVARDASTLEITTPEALGGPFALTYTGIDRVLYATHPDSGLVRIDPVDGTATAIGGPSGALPALAGDPVTGALYAGGGSGQSVFYSVSALTGLASVVGPSGLGFAAIAGLDFRADGVLFAAVNIAGDGGTGADHLATIDPQTGIATVIGPFGACPVPPVLPSDGSGACTIEGMEAIVFDDEGGLWGVVREKRPTGTPGLYGIDPTTGAATWVAEVRNLAGQTAGGGIVSLARAPDGTIYGGTTARTNGTDGARLVVLDLSTGIFRFAGPSYGPTRAFAGLAFGAPPPAPVVE